MIVGGEEEAWDVGEGFWKKEGERNGCFPRLHEKIRLETLKCFCSREKKRFSHTRRYIQDRNGQIVDIYPMNLQTTFREDPTVNECRRALLPRQLRQLP